MPLYEMTADSFRAIDETTFADMKVRERDDLQRLLRGQIEVIGDDLYVLTEEFSDWEDSKRRIDLLALDRQANLVVIELKRTNDGSYMELQAIRYAGMVSAMTFERAEKIHGEYLARIGQTPDEARERILEHLGWDEPDEENFAADVRIVLVSEDFGKELTTAVLWLRDHDIDIRCVRLKPYKRDDARLVEAQQIIPLPEVNDYLVQLREKEQVERKMRSERQTEFLRFWQGLVAITRRRKTRHANLKPGPYYWLGASAGIRGLGLNYVLTSQTGVVELYIDRGDADENKHIFDQLHSHKDETERAFGAPLSWERLDGKRACRIKYVIERGGYRSPETEWPEIHKEMVEAMTRLETALQPGLDALGL